MTEAEDMTDKSAGTAVGGGRLPPVRPSDGPPAGGSGAGEPPKPSMSGGDKVRFVVRGIGQTLITGGLVVLLFVVYEVYVTNWFAQHRQDKVHTALEHQWAQGTDVLGLPGGELAKLAGRGIANLYIPRLGLDYAWTIVEGIGDADLEKGPGHYPNSQLPGQRGDFAVAGHRVGKGEPFLNLDQVRAGDPIIVETQKSWFVYCVIGVKVGVQACDPNAAGAELARVDANGVPGREIVSPSDGGVVLPVPSIPSVSAAAATTAYLTMTTCHPKFTASERMIVHAVLDPAYPQGIPKRAGDAEPAQIKAFYAEVGN
jgi:sortase A